MSSQARSRVPTLYPYQREAGYAVLDSAYHKRGRTITIEMARQGGKNELSAQIELLLLGLNAESGGDIIKCAPTFAPQLLLSSRRLWQRIRQGALLHAAQRELTSITFGQARVLFLSAAPGASVVGHTASLLLEVDEAQDVEPDKFDRDFRPMAATTNATTVLYGTAWDDTTLLERAKQANLEAERRDGVRRHFEADWQMVARYNPSYAAYVESERVRLGETHPMFLTQYCLKPIAGGGRFLSPSQRAQLAGTHERIAAPVAGESYVAGLDLAGGDPSDASDEQAHQASPHRDATVLTIGRVVYAESAALISEPRVEIVEHLAWTGERHDVLLARLVDLLKNVWRVQRVAVDATGLGETIARLLTTALAHASVIALKFTSASKSELGFDLLAAINGGRLKTYRGDGSAEHRQFWREAEAARVAYRANRTMNFYVDPAEGHDDYITSAALLIHASRGSQRRVASGRVRV